MKEVTIPMLPSAAQSTPGHHESLSAWGEQLRCEGSQCHGPGAGTGSAASGCSHWGPLSPVLDPGRGWGRRAERGGACSAAQEQMRKVR